MSNYKAHLIRVSYKIDPEQEKIVLENLLDTIRKGYDIISSVTTPEYTEYIFRRLND